MSIVVRCATKTHRVKLDPKRFWATARCPGCHAPVDPTRIRRSVAWLADRYRHSGTTPAARVTWVAGWTALGLALLAWVFLWGLGDRWWPATLLLFGPRWVLLLPLLVLVPAVVRLQRGHVITLLLATVIVVGPVMGFRIGWRSWLSGPVRAGDLRLMTFNAQGGWYFTPASVPALAALDADVIAIQECGSAQDGLRPMLEGWYHHAEGPLCLSSRFPIDRVDKLEREGVAHAGGSGWVLRYDIRTPQVLLHLTNLHLETPRQGLEAVREGRIQQGAQNLDSKSVLREIESRRARRSVDEAGSPALVAGDFNLPVESVIYQRYWGDMRNAFSAAGWGFGSTRYNGWIRARIDHIVLGEGWRAVRAFVGPDVGSDHRPMIADLRWVGSGAGGG